MSAGVVIEGNVSNIGFWNCTFTSDQPQPAAIKIKAKEWVFVMGGSIQGGIDIEADEHVSVQLVDLKSPAKNDSRPLAIMADALTFPTSFKSALKATCATVPGFLGLEIKDSRND